MCWPGCSCCVCGFLGHLAAVHWCARPVRCLAFVLSWAAWLLFTGVLARCLVLCVRCPGPLGSCASVCPLRVFCCVCGFLGHLTPVHGCARSVCCVACAVSSATWLLFTGVPARCAVLGVQCPGPLGSCSPVCSLGALCCVCGVLGHLAPVHRCVGSVFCVACAVSSATWLLFTGVPARCAVLGVQCPGPLGSCSPVCSLGALCCVCGVLGHLAPVHRCVGSVFCVVCAESWATWLLFTGVLARCLVMCVRCPGLLGCCSRVCLLSVLCCLSGFLGHLAAVYCCARSVRCLGCAVSWATWLLFTGVPAWSVVLRATWLLFPGMFARCFVLSLQCPGPLGSCSPVHPLGVWCRVVVSRVRCRGPLGCCSPVCPLGVLCHVVGTRVRCPGPLGSCSPVCWLGALCCVCGGLGHLAPVHLCACSSCRVAWLCRVCAVVGHWAPVLLCARSVCCVACLCRMCGVLGQLVPIHRCVVSMLCVVCAVSWATWLLFTGVLARSFVLCVRCCGRLGSCSPVCPLGALCCARSVLRHLALVPRCVGSVSCVFCAVSWASWLLFTGVTARCVVLAGYKGSTHANTHTPTPLP